MLLGSRENYMVFGSKQNHMLSGSRESHMFWAAERIICFLAVGIVWQQRDSYVLGSRENHNYVVWR